MLKYNCMEHIERSNAEGAAYLHKLLPELHEQPHVQVSALHAERKLGNLVANPKREIAIGHHLTRLDDLMQKGQAVEGRLWEAAISDLVIKAEDIPSSYWDRHPDIADEVSKIKEVKQIQKSQYLSAASWANYLKNSGDQYPTWFKYYAWDGLSRMGRFNPTKGMYYRRDLETVAPYPRLNPATLAKVYGRIINEDLASSTSFNQLYSDFLRGEQQILPVPEDANDVRGIWREFRGEWMAKELSEASQITPWCIASDVTAQHYLESGSEFYLFHLQDPATNEIGTSAVASIRVKEGRVVEISGLRGNGAQILDTSLIPVVEEMTIELGSGEELIAKLYLRQEAAKFAKEFAEKLNRGDKLTTEELRMVYFNESSKVDINDADNFEDLCNAAEGYLQDANTLDDLKVIYGVSDFSEVVSSLAGESEVGILVDMLNKPVGVSRLEIAEALIAHCYQDDVVRSLSAFKEEGVIDDVARLVFDSGYTLFSKAQMALISDPALRKQIATAAIDSGIGVTQTKEVITTAQELDPSLAISLIESGQENMVIRKLDHFYDHSLIARALLTSRRGKNMVGANLDRFSSLSLDIAEKLIEDGKELTVARSIKRFDEAAHEGIAKALVESGAKQYVCDNLKSFTGLSEAAKQNLR
jgi:hypothetical protein